MKALALLIGRRALKRWAKKHTVSVTGGSAASIVLTGVLLAFGVPDDAAMVIGPALGSAASTIIHLAFDGDAETENASGST